jgi:hypothetical protein
MVETTERNTSIVVTQPVPPMNQKKSNWQSERLGELSRYRSTDHRLTSAADRELTSLSM